MTVGANSITAKTFAGARVLVVGDDFEPRGLITVKDIVKTSEHPNANKDSQGRLRVGAAVGTGGDTEQRVAALVAAGVDVLQVQPGGAVTANVSANASVPDVYRVRVVHSAASNFTYSVSVTELL